MKKNWAENAALLILAGMAVLGYIDDHDIFTDKSMAEPIMILSILCGCFFLLALYNKNKDK